MNLNNHRCNGTRNFTRLSVKLVLSQIVLIYVSMPNTVGVIFYICHYMLMIASDYLDAVNGIKQWLKSRFEIKDMGEAKYVPSIKITRDLLNQLLTLSQKSYLETVLKRFNMMMCKSVDTPIDKSENCPANKGPRLRKIRQ